MTRLALRLAGRVTLPFFPQRPLSFHPPTTLPLSYPPSSSSFSPLVLFFSSPPLFLLSSSFSPLLFFFSSPPLFSLAVSMCVCVYVTLSCVYVCLTCVYYCYILIPQSQQKITKTTKKKNKKNL